MPPIEGSRRNIAVVFVTKKTTVTELPGSKKKLSICSAVSTEYRRVTDGQTSCDGIVLAMHARRAVKWVTRATTVSTGIVIVTTA